MEEATATVSQVEESNLLELQETVTSMAMENPEDAARLIRTWLLETDNETIDKDYTGCQKAAIFLVSIGLEVSAEIFKYLREDEIDALAFEITKHKTIWAYQKSAVLQEFHKRIMSNQFVSIGGIDFACELLAKSLGSQKADAFFDRFASTAQVQPFGFIRKIEPTHLLNFIRSEHPQTIALILTHLEPSKAAVILKSLSNDMQSEVSRRIAKMGMTSPKVVREVERVLEKKLSTLLSEKCYTTSGVKSLMEILNRVGTASEKQIIEALKNKDPELAQKINRVIVFEDIVLLSDRAIQKVMHEVNSQELAKALKNVDIEVQDKIFKNMSKRAATMLKEDMEYMGPVRFKDVDEAQQKIISIIKHLEDIGEIVIAYTGEDETVPVEEHAKPKFDWSNIPSLSRNEIEMILRDVDYKTLITALKLTRQKIYKKLTEPMGFFKQQKLKSDIKGLKDLGVDEVDDAQNKIVSIIQQLHSNDSEKDTSLTMENING